MDQQHSVWHVKNKFIHVFKQLEQHGLITLTLETFHCKLHFMDLLITYLFYEHQLFTIVLRLFISTLERFFFSCNLPLKRISISRQAYSF